MSLRYEIGTDYVNYQYIYETLRLTGEYPSIEPGFILLNRLGIFFHLPFEGMVLIYSFITLFFILKAIPKKFYFLFFILYISSNIYFQSFSLIRQFLAMAIILYAIKYIIEEKFFLFLNFVLLAFLFHKSALLIIPFYFFKKINITWKYGLYVFIFLFFIQYIDMNHILFDIILPYTSYDKYIGGAFFMKEIKINGGLGVVFRILSGVLILLYSDKIIKKYPQSKIILILLFSYELFYILSLKVYIVNRVVDFFSIFYIYAITYFVYTFTGTKKLFIGFIVITLFLILMYKNIVNDYYTKSGGIGVVPYKSLLD